MLMLSENVSPLPLDQTFGTKYSRVDEVNFPEHSL